MSSVLHQPRVAWDFARAATSVAADDDDELYIWFGTRVNELLGSPYRRELNDTRRRLAHGADPDVRLIETSLWRVRIDDLLRLTPELSDDLRILGRHAATRLTDRERHVAA